MKHSLKILDENKQIKSMFVKANNYIINKYDATSDQMLFDAWKEEYNAKIVNNSIEFASEHDQIIFSLRWGN